MQRIMLYITLTLHFSKDSRRKSLRGPLRLIENRPAGNPMKNDPALGYVCGTAGPLVLDKSCVNIGENVHRVLALFFFFFFIPPPRYPLKYSLHRSARAGRVKLTRPIVSTGKKKRHRRAKRGCRGEEIK
ncbi:hypothetical protein PUN28_003270 [Cardiocondyla obscurior]|uniref:Uncharacterized protein n=1 Tax=Cardiocondyla obscurior TaxID=286306 RepID=A0AAW2GKX9_9HYME